MVRLAAAAGNVGDVVGRHRAIAGDPARPGLLHAARHRPRDLQRLLVGRGAHAVGAVVAGAALDGDDLGARHQRQELALGPVADEFRMGVRQMFAALTAGADAPQAMDASMTLLGRVFFADLALLSVGDITIEQCIDELRTAAAGLRCLP